MKLMKEKDNHYKYSVAWVDSLHKKNRGVLTCGEHAKTNELDSKTETSKQSVEKEKKDLFSEETNFLSIPLYSSERTGRERKKPLPKKFLDEWNKEIQERGDLNPKREID